MADETTLNGVNSHNTREYKIKAFLAKPPARAVMLLLSASASEGTVMTLGEWERSEVAPMLAPTILESLDQHALELRSQVKAVLSWNDESGAQVKAMVLNRQASHITEPQELVMRSLQGDAGSLVLQAQRQQENMSRLYMSGIHGTMTMNERMADRALALLEAQTTRLATLERENGDLKAALLELQSMLEAREAGESTETSEAQAKAMKLVEQFAPLILQRLMTPPTVAPS